MKVSDKIVADVMAMTAENEALRAALDDMTAEKAKWFDIALTRLGTIQRMAYEISVLENKIKATSL